MTTCGIGMHDSPTIVFVLSVGLLLYFLIGYPVLLAVFPWRHRPPIAKDPARVRPVTVLLPVYNGARFLRQKLESILALDYPRELLEDSGHFRRFHGRNRHHRRRIRLLRRSSVTRPARRQSRGPERRHRAGTGGDSVLHRCPPNAGAGQSAPPGGMSGRPDRGQRHRANCTSLPATARKKPTWGCTGAMRFGPASK